jgi:acyl-CoA thioesterase
MSSRFATDTAIHPRGGGVYDARIDPGWWIERGPNGGYVAALVLRAVIAEVAEAERRTRSFTIHYLSPPVEGPVEVLVTVERQGRSLTSASARLVQEDRLLAIAVGAFSTSRPSIEFNDLVMPDVPPPEALVTNDPRMGPVMRLRYEQRWAVGPLPFSGGAEALAGGWIRLAPAERGDQVEGSDDALLVAMADAWVPPVFSRLSTPAAVPTIDLTVHLRGSTPTGLDDWVLVVFRSSVASDGFIEVDGELWSRDASLLAQSRQLAVFLV